MTMAMHKMIKKIFAGALIVIAGATQAAEGGIAWDRFPTEKLTNNAALQNGAKLFVNHCLNCHAAAYMRFNRMHEIGLTDEQIKNNLLFTTDKVGETMKVAMDGKQAKEWFGATPPDLSVIARSRAGAGGSGADYLYTYLRTYYRDSSTPTGWNNLAYPKAAMPHVLWELQGPRELKINTIAEAKGGESQHSAWEEVQTVHAADGSVSEQRKPLTGYNGHGAFTYEFVAADTSREARYNDNVADLVAFMQWMGEPVQKSRVQIGVWVLLFLSVFTVIAWFLNAAYWKNIK
jgi:ubiquinol-cytochrome c reductase cytochrome c1 subunit